MISNRRHARFPGRMARATCLLLGIFIVVGCRRGAIEARDRDADAGVRVEARPDQRARCARMRACLRAKLPAEYNGPQFDISSLKLEECLGSTPREIFAAGRCLPFRFATDRRNGQAVELGISISHALPEHPSAGIRYSDVTREEECLCLSGAPGFDGGGPAYSRCFPSSEDGLVQPRRAPVRMRNEFDRTIIVDTLHFGSRTRFFELEDRDIVETVDGKRVEDFWAFRSMIQTMPELAPDTMVPISEKPEDISLIVAGGPGSHSVFVPVSAHTKSVTREVVLSE